VTHLRQMMLDELQCRTYAKSTADAYVLALKDLANKKNKCDILGRQFEASDK
jgi:hypothetical protein